MVVKLMKGITHSNKHTRYILFQVFAVAGFFSEAACKTHCTLPAEYQRETVQLFNSLENKLFLIGGNKTHSVRPPLLAFQVCKQITMWRSVEENRSIIKCLSYAHLLL